MRYTPHSDQDIARMLSAIGVKSIGDLFKEIPEKVRMQRPLNLGAPLSEHALLREMRRMAGANGDLTQYVSFMGAGAYDHYIPAALRTIVNRQEFVTAYTPYQAEVSQGVLQTIFEYQSMITALTAMDVSNASMYDGATAMAEAANMCAVETRKNRILVSGTVHPEYRAVLDTYAWARGYQVEVIPAANGVTDAAAVAKMAAEAGGAACVVVQSPNFYGIVEDLAALFQTAHDHKALTVAVVDPLALGVLEAPGNQGADIVVGEGQGLGNPVSFGGPFLGFMACREALIRRLPGRVVGMTKDHDDRRGFVLTLQTREQHIRREKATSNICSNQALNALSACVYLSLIGKEGLREVGVQCINRAHYAAERITALPGYKLVYPKAPFFKEFLVETPLPARRIFDKLSEQQILAGVPMDALAQVGNAGKSAKAGENQLLIAVTESRTREEIDALVRALEGLK
ncbi:MAG TPA: aminomethyl-transferring glycine dehydrogenase subunit GcvPA [Firmicutes bacterium]|nr:aminomethyl-transferring glycine dehydrogenase subunit GcvPA [Bacillota bacterium]HCF91595.1 aminomethyl-transferring glycine dehydrogenase subunit GcvPA [Bacillota bacterium]HCM18971.1 aminomethyl-transferring glycine dehydrogenase subunit GcvPA [Bacillota bacterium]HCT37510.1 aminomethyl-transferring glycine dehydrogenase subunit GcvPA [Bacillota bacterium]